MNEDFIIERFCAHYGESEASNCVTLHREVWIRAWREAEEHYKRADGDKDRPVLPDIRFGILARAIESVAKAAGQPVSPAISQIALDWNDEKIADWDGRSVHWAEFEGANKSCGHKPAAEKKGDNIAVRPLH